VLDAPRLAFRFFWSRELRVLCGAVHFGAHCEGPPGGAHGASIATVFDEILAYPVWRSGVTAFTANLNMNLRRMVPLHSTLYFEAYIERRAGRKLYVRGKIADAPLTRRTGTTAAAAAAAAAANAASATAATSTADPIVGRRAALCFEEPPKASVYADCAGLWIQSTKLASIGGMLQSVL
jgi:hypothetical protein